MNRISDQDRSEIRRLYMHGIGPTEISRRFECSITTVYRIVDPAYNEMSRRLSREAQKRRRGVCKSCGGETLYNGHAASGVSSYCASCNADLARERGRGLRGTGPQAQRLFALLDRKGPLRYMQIVNALGWTEGFTGAHLARLRSYGLIVRLSRGVYGRSSSEVEKAA